MTAARALTLVIVAAALLFVLADVVALPRSTIEIAPATPVQFLKTIGALMVIAIAARVVRRRMEAKPALIAAFLRRAADGLRIIVEAGVLLAMRRWRLPLCVPAPPPMTSVGRFS